MSLKDEFRKLIARLTTKFAIPPIADIFFPPFHKGGQPKDAEFMAVSLDTSKLGACNKILCTSTTLLNHSLDEILTCCSPDAFVSVIGPTAGYFPDALFARGVDVVGGRVVKDGPEFLQLLAGKKRWGDATRKICFQKETYAGISL